ncbi:hypothetical protein K9M16_03655 [Candidatus Babeliales bacterium]|nr:hypothetical protein [Candidatus Babeliales bacterium]
MNIKFIYFFLLSLFFINKTSFTNNIENLSLYNYLKNIDQIILDDLNFSKDSDYQSDYQIVKSKIDRALELFNSIHTKLKDNNFFYNFNHKIIKMFLDICQDLSDFEQIEIRDLRSLKYKILDFDNYLENYKYVTKKQNLREQELQFISELQEFNKILLDSLLDNYFLNSNFDEKFIDLFFYRPKDFICRHKLFFGVATCLAASILGSCIIYKLLPKCGAGGHNSGRSSKSKYEDLIIQLNSTQQSGCECGLHAIKNALILKLFNNQEDIQKMLLDKDFENYLFKICRKYILQIRDIEFKKTIPVIEARINLLETELAGILGKKLRKEKETQLAMSENQKKDLEQRRKNTSWLANDEISRCIDYLSRERSDGNDHDLYDIPVFFISSNEQNNKAIFQSTEFRKNLFKNNNAESIIVRDGNHWFAAKLIPDSSSPKGVKIIVTNSLSYGIKDSKSLEQIVDWYLE